MIPNDSTRKLVNPADPSKVANTEQADSIKKSTDPDILLQGSISDKTIDNIVVQEQKELYETQEKTTSQATDPLEELKKPLNPDKPIIGPPPKPVDPTLEKIRQLTERLKMLFKFLNNPRPKPGPMPLLKGVADERSAGMPFINPDFMLKELFDVLSKHTGIEATDKNMKAVKAFFEAYGKGKAADTNADGKNDFNDVLNVFQKGNFDAIAWSPEEGNDINWPPKKPVYEMPNQKPIVPLIFTKSTSEGDNPTETQQH